MSLINDMLRDLERRKAPAGTLPRDISQHGVGGEAVADHIEALRHTDVTPPVERRARRRLSWLFWPFLLVLLAVAGALYLLRSQGTDTVTAAVPVPAKEAGRAAALDITSPPAMNGSSATPTRDGQSHTVPPSAPPKAPRLVMLSAVAQGQGLRLDFGLDVPAEKPLRLSREGEQVSLFLPGVLAAPLESPHPSLRDWHSAEVDGGWRIGFLWPTKADVRMRMHRSEDGLQHWELVLAPEPAAPASAEPPGAKAARTPPPPPQRASKPASDLTPAQKAEALYAEAWLLQQKGRAELAMDKLRQVVQIQPEHVRARELLVRLLLRTGQPRAAEAELARGLEILPRQPEWVELMARMLADQGRILEALGLLRERMQVDRLAHQVLFAALAARAGNHAEAAEAYLRAAALDPRDPRWPLGRAIALENSGQLPAARAAYAQALGFESLDDASRIFARERLQHLGQGE